MNTQGIAVALDLVNPLDLFGWGIEVVNSPEAPKGIVCGTAVEDGKMFLQVMDEQGFIPCVLAVFVQEHNALWSEDEILIRRGTSPLIRLKRRFRDC